ncbi:TPA: hypothetical protein DDZ86_02570 [Candidatus Dependentiae bacterium]|nr:MAG: ATP synthase subunit a [candidate division TM6 bacterium GW2011_GWF2_43_87]HBL98503.1 hypothetical protein [Candidatus Dependentiae bacterium]
MSDSLFGHAEKWNVLAPFGITSDFFAFNKETLICTWAALGFVLVFALVGRWLLQRPESVGGHIVVVILRSFESMVVQGVGRFHAPYFYYVASLFIYIAICNALVVIPGLEEPTKDLSTTFALGVISFFYTQTEAVRAHGPVSFFLEYFKMPLTLFPGGKITFFTVILAVFKGILNLIIGCFSLPLELLSKLSSLMSLSLRLFGNIFGGSVISMLLKGAASNMGWLGQTLALVTGINLIVALFFGLFEAFIQAFVFSTLSLTYISMVLQSGDESAHASHASPEK